MRVLKIVTSYQHPPIPVRDCDWCAHYDGEEEAGGYGWGTTEAEAIQDFIDNCADDHDARLGIARHLTRHEALYMLAMTPVAVWLIWLGLAQWTGGIS